MEKTNLLFDIFAGEFVRVITSIRKRRVTEDESGYKELDGTYMFEGYLLECDDSYIYLGKDSDKVSGCIKKDDITALEIVPVIDEYDAMLEDFTVPKGRDSVQ